MRIIYNNEADSATIVASSTASASLSVSNLVNEYKGSIHRSVGTSVTYTLTWANIVQVGGVCLPATNLSPTATIQVKLYTNTADVTPIASTAAIQACPGANLELWNWSQPINSNAFIYGGASKSSVWFTNQYPCKKCEIIVVDVSNTAGYIDCAKIVCGTYWEPTYNISNGSTVSLNDLSSTSRNDSGDLLSDRGYIHDSISFDFSILLDSDISVLNSILRKIGVARNILISLFPDQGNSLLEQNNTIYGKRSNAGVTTELFGIYKHAVEIEGW